ELAPELKKISELEVLDLHPALKENSKNPPPEVVAAALESFAAGKRKVEPDLILFYARSSLLSDAVFDQLRQRWKCPLLGMNLDDKTEFFPYGIFTDPNDDYKRWAKNFDLNLSSSLLATEWYKQFDLPVLYSPMGFHQRPEFATPPSAADYKFPISFVGSRRIERERIIFELQKAGIPVSLFGTGWDSQWVSQAATIY